MLPIDRARSIAGAAEALPPQRRPLAAAIGCMLAEPLIAQQNIPHAATSAMDGWAVTDSDQPQWKLKPDGADRPEMLLDPLRAGEAVAVVTGSPVPENTYSVLRSEHGEIQDGEVQDSAEHGGTDQCSAEQGSTDQSPVLVADTETPDLAAGRNVRPEAAEAHAGDLLSAAGKVITPARAAAAAVAGYDELLVTPKPTVQLLLTGGEVITSGLPKKGEVRDVFGLALPQMLVGMGADVAPPHRMGDDAEALVAHIQDSPADLIITTGGTAHSRADVLRPALKQLGAKILVSSVDMRPGHPALLAKTGSKYVVGLPGNPLAGFTALAVLADPLLRALRGLNSPQGLNQRTAGERLAGARRGVRVQPVQITAGQVRGLDHAQAHMMRGLADADALAVIPPGGVEPGDFVECLPVPGGCLEEERGVTVWDG